jgi:hypothetical protein
MRAQQLITEGRDAPLYHGVMHTHAISHLTNNRIEGRTTQRFWPDGRRLKDNHKEYKDSFWLKGVSLTRTKSYAQHWRDIVFELDQTKLSKKYKMIPFNWGYANSRTRGQNYKRETEEFLVLGRIYKSMQKFLDDHNNEIDMLWDRYDLAKAQGDNAVATTIMAKIQSMPGAMEAFTGPTQTNIEPLDQYLLGIYADSIHKTLAAKNMEIIFDHPKFKGFYG